MVLAQVPKGGSLLVTIQENSPDPILLLAQPQRHITMDRTTRDFFENNAVGPKVLRLSRGVYIFFLERCLLLIHTRLTVQTQTQ